MNSRLIAVSITLLIFVTVVMGCSSQASPSVETLKVPDDARVAEPAESSEEQAPDEGGAATMDGRTLVETRCTKCHGLEKIESAGMNTEEWKSTVERMVSKGAELSDEEQAVVIEYLAATYP